jgi:uncharacterized protein (TIGR00369 family)
VCLFAANSRVTDVLVLTVSVTVHFLRPVTGGDLRVVGSVVHGGARLFVAEARLVDQDDRLLGHASDVFSGAAFGSTPPLPYA